ncbi:MAG: SDR family oxidoreductase [Actinomycetia bacterium]|nr:SDR family oxidoreductase [Actinomycetes bacterium]
MSVNERRAIVVGASSGMGRAIAADLIASGASVALVGRNSDALEEVAGGDPRHLALVGDVLNQPDVDAVFERVSKEYGGLDIAVNTVGMLPPPTPAADIERADLERTMLTNVVGVHAAMRHEIALMRETGGAIVNVSSNLGPHKSLPGFGAYGASKAALSALTKSAALDHVAEGIRINAISPGPSDTSMSYGPGESEADRAARMKEQNPSGRVASLEEIVAAVGYLTSPDAAYVVGADLVVDGGVAL